MNVVAQILALQNDRNQWTAGTLELMTDAAKLAGQLKGTAAAWILQGDQDGAAPAPVLADYGCHALHRLSDERLSLWSSEAVAAALAQNTVDGCRAVFLPGTSRGEEVAALLSVRLSTVWVPNVMSLMVTRSRTLEITAVEPGGRLSRTHRAAADRPAVVTIRAGVAEARMAKKAGDIRIEDRTVDLSDVAEQTQIKRFLPADPRTVDIAFAERIVAGGRGTAGRDGMQLVAALAGDLNASTAASRLAVDLGWAAPERQVGQTGKTVRPDLYVACGISGASHHLAGMRDSRHIVAINSDPEAPIHDVAHLSLHGDLNQVIRAIRDTIARRRKESPRGTARNSQGRQPLEQADEHERAPDGAAH